jgi:hypothetical protein
VNIDCEVMLHCAAVAEGQVGNCGGPLICMYIVYITQCVLTYLLTYLVGYVVSYLVTYLFRCLVT